MAYRFTLKEVTVECDNLTELLAALPGGQAVRGTGVRRKPYGPRAKKGKKKTDDAAPEVVPASSKRGGGFPKGRENKAAVESWRLANAYAKHRGIPPKQARTEIAASLRKKNKALELAGPA